MKSLRTIVEYYINNKIEFPFDMEYKGELNSNTPGYSSFKVLDEGKEYNFMLGLIGKHKIILFGGINYCLRVRC